MASLFEKINDDLKKAMKEKQVFELAALRLLLAALKNKKIEVIGSEDKELTDEQVIAVAGSEIKKRKDSIEAYAAGNRPDLAAKEQQEIEIIGRYMPSQLSGEEVETVVKKIIAGLGEVSPKDFGRVMGLAMKELKGRSDGKLVGEMVKKVLGE
jgi:hypothetical protein